MFKSNNEYIRTSIALNNIGIKLLECQCYIQAMDTINDAVSLLKLNLSKSSTSVYSNTLDVIEHLKCAKTYHHALDRLSTPEKNVKLNSNNNVYNVYIQSISTNELNQFIALHDHNNNTVLKKVHPIKIQDIDLNELNNNLDTIFSLLFHNLGIVYLLMSMTNTTSSLRNKANNSKKCMQTALKLFRISYSLYTKVISVYTSSNNNIQCLQNTDTFQLMSIIINSLIQTLIFIGQKDEAQIFCTKLVHIKTFIQEFEQSNRLLFSTDDIAAAAA